jgi:MFS transporter, putative metabolite:H+ symporter
LTVARLDALPLKALHVAAACGCAVGFGIDLLEVSISNALATVFSAPPHALTSGMLSLLLASAYLGAVIGAPLIGLFADRAGLKRALTGTLLWIGLMSSLAAARADPLWFSSFRFLSGIALGAYPPLMIAYLTAIAPSRYRGIVIFWVCGLAYLAPPLGVLLIRWLTPWHPFGIEGWRWPFLIAGAAAMLVGVAFSGLPESPRWLLQTGRAVRAEEVLTTFERSRNMRALDGWFQRKNSAAIQAAPQGASSRAIAKFFAFAVILYALHPWAASTFPLLTGPMLLRRGHDLNDALLYVALATFGPAVSTFVIGLWIDRAERRVASIVTCALMGFALGAFFGFDERGILAAAVIAYAVGVAIYTPIMTVYGAEMFPIQRRASATGIAWAANRLSAALVPIVMLPWFTKDGAKAVAMVVSATLVATIVLILRFGPKDAATLRGRDPR